MNAQAEPSQDELLAMAYVDGELDAASRHELETRLASDRALAGRVAHYRALEILARQMAPPEPTDVEWERLESEAVHSTGTRLGWGLLALGAAALIVFGIYGLATSSAVSTAPKACIFCLIGGFAILLGLAVRARVRLLPFDPYRKVQR